MLTATRNAGLEVPVLAAADGLLGEEPRQPCDRTTRIARNHAFSEFRENSLHLDGEGLHGDYTYKIII